MTLLCVGLWFGSPKKLRMPVLRGPAVEGRNAAVGHALVAEILVAEADRGRVADAIGELRIDTVAAVVHPVAIAVGLMVHAGHAHGHAVADRVIGIRHAAREAVGAGGHAQLALVVEEFRHGGDAVDDAAAAPTSEDHGIRALQHLEAIHVVEVTVVLRVVAHAVGEHVRGGGLAAQHGRVAIALALGEAGAGDIAQRLLQVHGRLVVQHIARHDDDALGRVAKRRVGAHGGAGAQGLIAVSGATLPIYRQRRQRDGLRRGGGSGSLLRVSTRCDASDPSQGGGGQKPGGPRRRASGRVAWIHGCSLRNGLRLTVTRF